MKKLVFSLVTLGFMIPLQSQEIVKTEQLSEVTVYATNYKYLKDVNTQEVASVPVQMLEKKVAAYDPTSSEFFTDEYNHYNISFYIPEGRILAAYNSEGKLLRTAERFQDVTLPNAVKKSIYERFPGWTITKDTYLVSYHDKTGVTKKYKLKLVNGKEVIRVKVDEKGEFL